MAAPIRFTAEWQGFPHTILVPHPLVEQEAGGSLTPEEAEAHVHQNLGRYMAAAHQAAARQVIPAERMVTIEEADLGA